MTRAQYYDAKHFLKKYFNNENKTKLFVNMKQHSIS